MKFLVYLIILIFVLRWISQAFKSNITYININHAPPANDKKETGKTTITGNIKPNIKGDIGDYVEFEEL
jgi:Na+-transporting methylmalonyl-CoA/oxaloacetate decarboxylase gamma subunit